jgi:hypothetical protein
MNFILKKITHKRRLLYCLLFFIIACQSKNKYDSFRLSNSDSIIEDQNAAISFERIYENEKLIQPGDLIVRTGKDFTSETFSKLSLKDKTYSHCGIASIEHDSIFVYHAIGGEWNPNQKLRRDAIEIFCNPFENKGFGIFRYKLSADEKKNLIHFAQSHYKKGIIFDMQFNLATDDRMYCSEFVYKAVRAASLNKIALSVTILHHIQFVAIDNLFIDSNCIEIKRVLFRRQ